MMLASVSTLRVERETRRERPAISVGLLHALPERLRAAQKAFDESGGLHAAALFSADGTLRRVYEDVGRHNADDEVVGAELLWGSLPGSASSSPMWRG